MALFQADQGAPPFSCTDLDGRAWQTPAGRESDTTLVLVFLRFVGCPVCQMRFWELERRRADYEALGARLLVVLQSDEAALKGYRNKKSFALSVVGDDQKRLFNTFGVGRASWKEYMDPAALSRALKATMSGYFHGRFGGDERQKPGDFIIDRDGTILLAHYGRHIADNLSDEELLAAVKAAGRA